ncbi:MAG: hypothetical protein ACT4NP_11375 [Pseudonocardiales bacterium]
MIDVPEAQRESRERVPDAPHGTLAGYQRSCGCMWCRSAKTAATVTISGTVKP